MLMNNMSRRKVLRGIVNGVAVGVALPLLDCFLLSDGQALAATGQRIPTRFGTWVWGCGFIPEKWVPTTTGSDYAMPADLAAMEPYRASMASLRCYYVTSDGVQNTQHRPACIGLHTDLK